MVEHYLAKVNVVGSRPITRSKSMAGWQSVYAVDCKPTTGRLNSYTGLQFRDTYSKSIQTIGSWFDSNFFH